MKLINAHMGRRRKDFLLLLLIMILIAVSWFHGEAPFSNQQSVGKTPIVKLTATPNIGYIASSPTANSMQIKEFNSISEPVTNPLMGWAPWANLQKITQPHTLVYADLTWREIEPEEGVFDFYGFEQRMQLDRWRQEGMRVVFRFVMDKPGDITHMDIPDWLYGKINGDGEFYDNQYGKGFSPNYANPILIQYHRLVITALGNRYGADGFFAFVELGSLGHWGEWHESPELMQLPAESIRDKYVRDYVDAFQGTHLLMRRPFTITRDLSLGLYNDMTGSPADTSGWFDWIQNGGDYLPGEKNTLVPMKEGWIFAPIGGEQAPTLSNEELYSTDLETTLQLLKDSHTSFIGPGGPYKVVAGGSLQPGLDRVMATIGYRIFIEEAELPLTVKAVGDSPIKLEFSNAGIAPFYYDWPCVIYLFDMYQKIVRSIPLEIDIRKIVPGHKTYSVQTNLPISDFEDGKYSIGFAIINPMTGKPGVKLINESSRGDMIQEVGTLEIERSLNRKQ